MDDTLFGFGAKKGSLNAYAKVEFAGNEARTIAIASNAPTWGTEFWIPVIVNAANPADGGQQVRVTIMDEDQFSEDDLIGTAMLDFDDIVKSYEDEESRRATHTRALLSRVHPALRRAPPLKRPHRACCTSRLYLDCISVVSRLSLGCLSVPTGLRAAPGARPRRRAGRVRRPLRVVEARARLDDRLRSAY